MEFLQANWIWILLAIGAFVFLARRGGMGCGMDDHGSHGSHVSPRDEQHPVQGAHDGHGSVQSSERPVTTGTGRRRGGCC